MVEIALGMDFSKAEEKSEEEKRVLPSGTYDLNCTGCKPGVYSKTKRPFIEFQFEVINDQEWNGKKLRHTCPLPWEGNNSGIGFLVDTTKALGNPWTGDSLNTEDFVSRSCRANIINTDPNEDDKGRIFANIKSFAA